MAASRSSSPTSSPTARSTTSAGLHLAEQVLAAEGVRGDAELSVLFVDEQAIADAQRALPRPDGPDRRALLPDRRRARPRAAAPRRRRAGTRLRCRRSRSELPDAARRRRHLPGGRRAQRPRARRHLRRRDRAAGRARHPPPARHGPRRRRRGRGDGGARARAARRRHAPAAAGPVAEAGRATAGRPCGRRCSPPASTAVDGAMLVVVVVLVGSRPSWRSPRRASRAHARAQGAGARRRGPPAARGSLLRLVERPGAFLNPSCCSCSSASSWRRPSSASWPTHLFGAVGVAVATVFEVVVIFVVAEAVPKNWAVQPPRPGGAVRGAARRRAWPRFPPRASASPRADRLGQPRHPGPTARARARSCPSRSCWRMADVAVEEDVIESEERALIHSIIEFGDTVVREVMVPAARHGRGRGRPTGRRRPRAGDRRRLQPDPGLRRRHRRRRRASSSPRT